MLSPQSRTETQRLLQLLPLHLSKITDATCCVEWRQRLRSNRESRTVPTSLQPEAPILPAPRPASRSRLRALLCTGALSARLDTNDALRHSVGGGGERNRTDDLLLAKQALSQLSYTPRTNEVSATRDSRALARRKRAAPAPAQPCCAERRQRLRKQPREPHGSERSAVIAAHFPAPRRSRGSFATADAATICAEGANGGPGRI